MSKIIKADEMARELGIGMNGIYRMLKLGQIPRLQHVPRGKYIVSREAFNEWLRNVGRTSQVIQ